MKKLMLALILTAAAFYVNPGATKSVFRSLLSIGSTATNLTAQAASQTAKSFKK